MSIIVKDILALPSLKEMKLLAGDKGLDRSIQWIYVAECFADPLESIKWLQGGEVVFITGAKMNGDLSYIEKIIDGISEVNAAGLIINIGPYIKEVPKEAINKADKLDIPLFIIPWSIKLLDISKEITNEIVSSSLEEKSLTYFLSNMLFGDGEITGNAVKKAAYFGYDLEGECCIAVIDIDKFQGYLEKRNIYDEEDVTRVKILFRRIVQEQLKNYGFNVPIIDKDDAVILFLKTDVKYMARIDKVLSGIQKELFDRMDGLTVSVGIGKGYSEIKLMKESLKEAEMAIKYSKCLGIDNYIEKYDNIGEYKLLLNLDNKFLAAYYNDLLKPILESDKKSIGVTFVKILEVYFNENCNVTTTAEKLFLHRNTLKYKLNKIEELLDGDLRDFNYCARLKLALDIHKILGLSSRTKII